jgi:hypothetical protein
MYLQLFHGRKTVDEQLEDWGTTGPLFGPLEFVHMTYSTDIKFAFTDRSKRDRWLTSVDGLIYYDGYYYGDSSTFETDTLVDPLNDRLAEFDQAKATVPQPLAKSSDPETIANSLTAIAGFAFQAQHSLEPEEIEQAVRQIVDASARAITLYRQFHLLRLEGGIEPSLVGPFATEEERDQNATTLRSENPEDVILAVDGPAASVRIEAYGPDFFNR